MRRQPQVSGPARHWPAAARAGRGRGTWGALRAAGRGALGAPDPLGSFVFPQNGDLKKQLHERQPRIAALSDKQVSEPEPVAAPRRGEGVAGTLAAP